MDNQELLTLLNNAGAIFEQIKQMLEGGGQEQGAPQLPQPGGGAAMSIDKVMKYLKELDEGKEDEEKDKPSFLKAEDEEPKEEWKEDDEKAVKNLIKSLLAKDAGQGSDTDAVAANDDAEDRIKDQPDENLDSIKEVAKALRLMAQKHVKKSQDDQLSQILTRLVDDNRELRKGLENLYEGLGIAAEIRKVAGVEKSTPSRQIPQDNRDVQKSLDEIKAQLGIKKEESVHPTDGKGFSLQKALTDSDGAALKSMLSVRNK